MARVVIAGCGYVGTVLGQDLVSERHEVFGLRRDPSGLQGGIHPVAADFSQRESLLVLPERVDYAVYCVGPDGPSEAAYRVAYLDGLERFLRALRDQGEKPRRIFFASSTAVHSQCRGEWVDEETAARATRNSGEILILAERLFLASGFDTTVVRFGGIYGPGRTRLLDRVAGGEARVEDEPHYTNRIHRDDAAGALRHLISVPDVADVYLGVDSYPADEADVLRYLAELLGVPAPAERGADEPAPSRRAGSKRCRNDRLRNSGYRFRYPSYREGYAEIVRQRRDAR
jgi:nucleoside-diphosphate-sugar epimerase